LPGETSRTTKTRTETASMVRSIATRRLPRNRNTEGPPHPSRQPDTVEVVVQAWMCGVALHLLGGGGENRTPEGLGDHRVVLQDFLHYGHVLAAFVDIEGGSRQVQSFVEGGIGVLALVPRHTRAISQFERHDAERAVCPGREAKWDFIPDLP